MSEKVVKFNTKDQKEFFKVLRKRVNEYFSENGITRYANAKMKFKTFSMLSFYFIPLVLLLTGVVSSLWMVMLMWVIMGFGMSGIGLAVMHDANHGSYSKNKSVNKVLGFMLNFLGGYHKNWKIQHNILHHTYTNIDGFDEDLEAPVLRLSPEQKPKKAFRFQAYYALFIYGIMTLYWITAKDFEQILRYKKKDLLVKENLTYGKALRTLIFHKIWYLILVLVLPIMIIDLPWWQVVLGFLLMHFVSGIILSLVFQSAHVVEETEFFHVNENGTVENNWAIHQMKTTANFSRGSKLLSWYVGGLNFQVEHHLFPNICHIHYEPLSHIVKATAEEFGVPYNEHKTFMGSIISHFKMLDMMGKDEMKESSNRAA